MMARLRVRYGNAYMFEKTSNIHASEIAGLNRNQASHRPENACRNAAQNRYSDASNEDEPDQGQQRSDSKDRSGDQAGEEVKCHRRYQT
jgi:hypothetical protein